MSKLEDKTTLGTSGGCGSETTGYWQDVENKVVSKKEITQEFADNEFDSFSVKKSRRNFLKIMGFSVSALPLTGCIKIPVRKALPYLNKQDNTIPGVPNWYASTFKGEPVLLKTREGRPIKVEGNDLSKTTLGGVGSQQQASVISLYDSNRLRSALMNGKEVEWDVLDKELKSQIEAASGKKVIVTPSITSPSELALIEEFSSKLGFEHISYDAISKNGIYMANEKTHGVFAGSEFDYEKANVVVSIDSDFLQSVNSTKGYVARRDAKHPKGMNRHIQIEARMSMTGSNADYRFTKSAADQRDILLGVYAQVVGGSHSVKAENKEITAQIVKELTSNKGEGILVSGSNNVDVQVMVNKINATLANDNSTIFVRTSELKTTLANDTKMKQFVSDMNAGTVDVALFVGVNPAYDYSDSAKVVSGLKKVKTSVSFALSADETSVLCGFNATANHVYESWGDSLVSASELSVVQPVIQPLFGTRMWTETLMSLASVEGTYYDFMKNFWASKISWNKFLHDGVVAVNSAVKTYNGADASSSVSKVKSMKTMSGLNIVAFVKSGMGNGDMANNPFLQELPNPITKGTWDNYAQISPKYAKANGIKNGDVVEVSNGKHSVKVPAILQPGTEENTVAIALGYGRTVAGKVAKNLGGNAFPFTSVSSTQEFDTSFGTVKKTGAFRKLALTQTSLSMEGRDIVRETTFAEYIKDNKAGNRVKKPKIVHIYPKHKMDGHQWAMAVNLAQCTGCSSCIVSCNTENNIPVVGRKEVELRRDMHWLRIDRYYKGDENQPEVVHQPMLCQHCENAPCENVCPVLATVHSSDGLNQQVYNRCVGTRYCANNCPYKVRRFNWFNYDRSNEIERMALNPDVGIRTRGIMEKCSMCIQRIQDGKLTAKRERRKLKDGDIKLACQQSCPGDGIVFGDMNDPESKVSKFLKDDRNYTVLEELNVRPRVSYLTKIRNK